MDQDFLVTSPFLLGCMMPVWVIQLSYRIAYCALALAVLVAVACFVIEARRGSFRWLPLYAVLLVLQPGWQLLSWEELHGVMYPRGDCGYGNRSLSLFLLGATAALFVIVWRRLPVGRGSFILGVVIAVTVLSFVDMFISFSGLAVAIPFDIYASIFTGFGGMPLDCLVLILVCVTLYFLRRLRFRKAVPKTM